MVKKKARNFKIEKITSSSKTLRAASYHFCDDILEASVNIKEKILEAEANKKIPKRLYGLMKEILAYAEYVKVEVKELKGSTSKEKEEEKKTLENNEEKNNEKSNNNKDG